MTEFWTIDEFPNLTAQEIFERSVRHVMKNGGPSVVFVYGRSACRYGGIGCGAAPFLTPEGRRLADGAAGGGSSITWKGLVARKYVPDSEHHYLIEALQSSHDAASMRDSEKSPAFIEAYVECVMYVARDFNVSVQHLNLPTLD